MSQPIWSLELHAHTIYSKDSLIRLDDLQSICQKYGVDKLAITDHNEARAALQMARMYPIWVIPGIEVMTTQGELLAWYIKGPVPAGLTPQETIKRLRDQGAVIGVAHPFDRYRSGAWQLEHLQEIVELVDAIEVFNSRCLHKEDNDRALAFARKHDKLMTCGSDAHTPREYGRAVLLANPFPNNANGLRQALKGGARKEQLSHPGVHLSSTFAKWVKRIRPSLQPE
jgi:predicted metal-dependent phosphoesterase TrpH